MQIIYIVRYKLEDIKIEFYCHNVNSTTKYSYYSKNAKYGCVFRYINIKLDKRSS